MIMRDKATLTVKPAILQKARDLRHPLTPAEAKIWSRVRNRGLGFKIRRQHPIERFIADFYCAEAKLVIEIDGDSHLEPNQIEYDKARTDYLENLGYRVIRFTNDNVRYNIEIVTSEILTAIEHRIAELKTAK
jgi:very-short-patch-repair endonuclease